MTTNPTPDRLDDLRTEYANTGMVTSDGAVWLLSQIVVLREQVQQLRTASSAAVPPTGPDAEIRRARYAAVIRKAGDTAYGNGPFVEAIADAVIAVAETEQAGLRRERDLAIAHDRQPYPTAWAYEQACKALHAQRERAEAAETVIAEVRAKHKPRTERHGSGCVQCGIVWPCPTYKALDEQELRRLAAEAPAPETQTARCACPHPADEHSVYGCIDGCACEWMPKRKPMNPWRILGIDAERDDPTQCSGEEGFCPEHGFHRHSLKQPAGARQPDTETPQPPAAGPTSTALRIRVLREVLARLDGGRGNGDSATEDVGAATVRAVLAEILAGVPAAASAGVQPDTEADPLRMSEELCPGFPDRCPNLRTIEPNPPEHLGGVRCGCADEEA